MLRYRVVRRGILAFATRQEYRQKGRERPRYAYLNSRCLLFLAIESHSQLCIADGHCSLCNICGRARHLPGRAVQVAYKMATSGANVTQPRILGRWMHWQCVDGTDVLETMASSLQVAISRSAQPFGTESDEPSTWTLLDVYPLTNVARGCQARPCVVNTISPAPR